ncbi:MAG: transglycosylase domain-containing protein [Bdellovibrionia bacterium]
MWKWIFSGLLFFWVVLYFTVQAGLGFFPTKEEITGCITTKMFQVELCPKNKNYLHLKNVPDHFIKALVVAEDSLFWDHNGFDWKSIEENLREGMRTKKFKRGGSTLSQQLAKNMFLSSERSFFRKGKEAIITLQLEHYLTKKEILEKYINIVEFGPKLYGLQNAAKYYFGKSPAQLNLAESAFLVMLLPNPKKYSSSFRQQHLTPFAEKRIRQIIDYLFQFKMIKEDAYYAGLEQVPYLFGGTPEPGFESNQGGSEDSDNEEDLSDDFFL